ncbi:hypothetical protein C7212DRAFT_362634 [Tuber magnatum]|uniref:Uncharacterized protein n=1 Tax=Tuber magnatum TaxID=42249 RepID=A0A317SW74_9PEZI|nr:hypothetical protein C7212DRAFT_362634 [Tuber magnatum]
MDPPPAPSSAFSRKYSASSRSALGGKSGQKAPRRLTKEERKSRYDRMEMLTRELTLALKDEMARRKDSWEDEGDQEEEQQWEGRKQEIYQGLSELADEIERAIRDRKKEAVLELWAKEMEERRMQRSEMVRRDEG